MTQCERCKAKLETDDIRRFSVRSSGVDWKNTFGFTVYLCCPKCAERFEQVAKAFWDKKDFPFSQDELTVIHDCVDDVSRRDFSKWPDDFRAMLVPLRDKVDGMIEKEKK